MLKYLIFFIFVSNLFSIEYIQSHNNTLTLDYISSKQKSRAKDFLIWQYLKQKEISPENVEKVYKQISSHSYFIYNAYIKKTKNKDVLKKIDCQNKQNLLDINDSECLKYAFSTSKLLKLSSENRKRLLPKLKYDSSKEKVLIIDEPYSGQAYKKYSADTILSFFNYSTDFRRKNLNIELDKELLDKLALSKMISSFVSKVVNDDNLDKLQKSLLELKSDKLNYQTNFFLALNHLKYKQKDKAIEFFKLSLQKTNLMFEKDKSNFWIYLISKDDNVLKKLSESNDINIYSIYAKELLNKEITNYFTEVNISNINQENKNIFDPFIFYEIRNEIKNTPHNKLDELANKYSTPNMIPIQTMILELKYKYKVSGFIIPYIECLENVSNDKKAIIYSLIRQESNFIPSAISSSFALGLMQLMPFLVDSLSKEFNEKIAYEDMFIPKYNLKYGLKHLTWMEKSLSHPLFIAYAYNGGMGFLKRHLLSTKRFSEGVYEPFLSLELMQNAEAREYGKKVLANYVMYKKIFGEDISIIQLFDTLKNPKQTDRFRGRD